MVNNGKIIGTAFTTYKAIEILNKHFKRDDIVVKEDKSHNIYFGTRIHITIIGVMNKESNKISVLPNTNKYIRQNIGLTMPPVVENYQRSVFGSKYNYINFNNKKYYLNKPNNVFPFKVISMNKNSNNEIIGVVFEAKPIKNIKRTW